MPNLIQAYREASTVDELADVLTLFLEDSQGYCVSRFAVDGGHELVCASGSDCPSVTIRIHDDSRTDETPDETA